MQLCNNKGKSWLISPRLIIESPASSAFWFILLTCGSSSDSDVIIFFAGLGVFYVVGVEESQVTFTMVAVPGTLDGHLIE